jgi:ABC-type Fe3+-siderophore transport system, permease component
MSGSLITEPGTGAAETSVNDLYHGSFRKRLIFLGLLTALLLLSSIYAASAGSAMIEYGDVLWSFVGAVEGQLHMIGIHINGLPQPQNDIAPVIVIDMRLPRILLAILTGMSLAVAGTVMQGVLRNPLVSPFTLGLASASSFGAAITIVLGTGILGIFIANGGNYDIVLNAFIFGLLSMFLIYGISRVRGTSQSTLILAGVVLGYIFQAGLIILKYLSNNDRLKDLEMWLMGGMWGASWNAIIILLPITIVCVILLALKAWDLNALAAGDEIAKNLGIRVERMRLYCLLLVTIAASSCLAFTGVIGFIGLMAPHICRMLIGNDHRYLIPCSALMGALILLLSDTFSRTVMSPVEIPVGIVMYILGGIFFLYLILKGRDSHIY